MSSLVGLAGLSRISPERDCDPISGREVCDMLEEAAHPGKLMADLFDEHVRDEFVLKDIDATMATMTAEPSVVHMPTLAGGDGHAAVREFYLEHFIPCWPADVNVTPIS